MQRSIANGPKNLFESDKSKIYEDKYINFKEKKYSERKIL
jgi:hypothetical protein